MTTVVIVIHLMVVLAMIGLVLLQRSEGGALGIGGGQGAFMSGRSAANVLTRSTAILAVAFFATSLGLALIAKFESRPADILERLPGTSAPATTQTQQPETPMAPPTSADQLLKELGGASSGGPQTPPAPAGSNSAPASAPTAAPAAAPTSTPAAPPASGDGSATPGAATPAPAAASPPTVPAAPSTPAPTQQTPSTGQ